MKVNAIKEADDITTMRLDELLGSLRTFELSFYDNAPKKKSSIVFQEVRNDSTKSNQKPT